MTRKRRRRRNAPKRKSFNRKQRLDSAKSWLPTYEGSNIVKGYRKRYGVDWPTAFKELEMLGVRVVYSPNWMVTEAPTLASVTASSSTL